MMRPQFCNSALCLCDKVEKEAEALRHAVERCRQGFRGGLEELLSDGRTHIKRLVVRFGWCRGEGEGWCRSQVPLGGRRLPLAGLHCRLTGDASDGSGEFRWKQGVLRPSFRVAQRKRVGIQSPYKV